MPPPPPSSPEADEEKWLVGTEVAAEGRKDGRNEGRQAGMKEEGGSSEREREREGEWREKVEWRLERIARDADAAHAAMIEQLLTHGVRGTGDGGNGGGGGLSLPIWNHGPFRIRYLRKITYFIFPYRCILAPPTYDGCIAAAYSAILSPNRNLSPPHSLLQLSNS